MLTGLMAALCLTGCVGTVSRVHIDDEPLSDVDVSDVDIRAMSREMATAIIELPMVADAKEPIHIAFLTMQNRTLNPDFDSYNLLSKIRLQLLEHSNGKLVFLEKEAVAAFLAERDAKRSGQVTTKGHKEIPGVDYFLTGYAYADQKAGSGGRVLSAHRYSFRLSDAETTVVVWEKDYEFKKLGRKSVQDR